jgi:hypothetical protein
MRHRETQHSQSPRGERPSQADRLSRSRQR